MSDAGAFVGDGSQAVDATPLSDRFLLALSTFDADALAQILTADAVAWRNVGNRNRTADEIITMLAHERTLVESSTFRVRHQSDTEDGFVVQFVFEGTTRGGLDFALPICIVARVAGGRITGFEEYTDEASMQPLLQEFFAHASGEAS